LNYLLFRIICKYCFFYQAMIFSRGTTCQGHPAVLFTVIVPVRETCEIPTPMPIWSHASRTPLGVFFTASSTKSKYLCKSHKTNKQMPYINCEIINLNDSKSQPDLSRMQLNWLLGVNRAADFNFSVRNPKLLKLRNNHWCRRFCCSFCKLRSFLYMLLWMSKIGKCRYSPVIVQDSFFYSVYLVSFTSQPC